MKNFLAYCFYIILSTFILMLSLDWIYTKIYREGSARNKVQNQLKLKNKHFAVGFYGSSRIERHIDCKLIEKVTGKTCLNNGFSGANMADILMLAEINKINGVTFDTIFVQLDYSYNFEGFSPYFIANLAPYLNDSYADKAYSEMEDYYFYKNIPFYKYLRNEKVLGLRELIGIIFQTTDGRNIEIGFNPLSGSGLNVKGKFPKKLIAENSKVIALEKLFKDKKLYFFTAPYCKATNNRESINLLNGKVKNYQNYAKLFDDKPEYFFDCGHLNEKGAKAFTKKIVEDYNF
ncbi:hypothetical protein E0K83_00165 [Gramella sp. BOM4]|nr:hypothetical protein [Christiangramia bathymodioli]